MKFKISLIYVIFLICSYFIYGNKILVALIISFLFHEIGHIVVILALRVKIIDISLNIFGGKLNIEGVNRCPIDDILIYISGPIINLILFLFGMFIKNSSLIIVNKYLLIFNLLPCMPLDGFYIMLNLNAILLPFYKAYSISLIISLFISIGILFLGIFFNIYMVILGFYFLYITIYSLKNKSMYHEILVERMSKTGIKLKNKEIKSQINIKKIIYKGKKSYFILNDKVYTDEFFLKKHLKKS